MVQTITGTLDINGEKIYYEVAGEGEPLVLCHAGFVDRRMWDDQWEAFSERYRVVRFDMRGYGLSDPASAPVSRRDDLLRLLQHLGIQRAALVGCSLGGEMVIDFALEHPDMVSALVVVSATPGGFEMQGEPPPHLMEMIAALQGGDTDLASELQVRIWVDGMFRQPEQVDSEVQDRAAEMNQIPVQRGTFLTIDSQPLNPLDPPAAGRLGELDIPVLIIAGALDHPEILRAADVMEAGINNAHKVMMPRSAHMLNMEKPDEFNRTVLEFLAKVK